MFCVYATETGLDPVVKNGVLAQVETEYAQLREQRSSEISSQKS